MARTAQPKLPQGLIANDGSGKNTPPSPVALEDKQAADQKAADEAAKGQGPAASNEPR